MKIHLQSVMLGFVAGAVTVIAAPVIVPAVASALRPLTKATLKAGVLGVERIRTAAARAVEAVDDLIAEVRAEVDAELTKGRGRATPASKPAYAANDVVAPRSTMLS